MEIKRYIPEVTAIGLAETAATVVATKSALEGNPQNIKELAALYGFATFYVGIPIALVITVAKNLYHHYKETMK